MTKDRQRIVLAESFPSVFHVNRFSDGKTQITWACNRHAQGEVETVDPLTDLNAIHEAEKMLSNNTYEYKFGNSTYYSSEKSDFYQLLMYGSQPCHLYDGSGKYNMPSPPPKLDHLAGGIHANCSQRLETLLRVIRKWED